MAIDVDQSYLPDTTKIPVLAALRAFACFFSNKVNSIVNQTVIEPSVYNGKKKVNPENKFFMTSTDIEECLKSIKTKNCEGFDRIPQRVLSDGRAHLIEPFTELFKKIYNQKVIPQQWSISKVIPIHKKV